MRLARWRRRAASRMFSPESKYTCSVSMSSRPSRSSARSGPSSWATAASPRSRWARKEPLDREVRGVGHPAAQPDGLGGPGRVDDVGGRRGEVLGAVHDRRADRDPGGRQGPPGRRAGTGRGRAAEGRVQCRADALEPRPLGPRQQDDATAHRQDGRQPDPGTRALRACRRRPDQVADAARQHLEVVLVEPRPVRGRVRLRPGGDRGHPERVVRVEPEPGGDAPDAGHRVGVRGDDAQDLLERAAPRLGVTREDLALGRAIAVRDHQGRHLGPQEDPAAHLAEGRGAGCGRPAPRPRSGPTRGAG